MKQLLIFITFLSFTISNAQTKSSALSFQQELNLQYANAHSSPLNKADRENFKKLPFYEWKKEYIVIASIKRTPKAPLFIMETTTERAPLYQQYAIATFILNGQKQQLLIYQSQESKFSLEYKDYLFLPFKDLSNGTETYEAGRYLDVFISNINNDEIILDFNKAYNPYCAYNHKYSCPIPPSENHLNTSIKSGVQKGFIKKED